MLTRYASPFYRQLAEKIAVHGGLHNAHLHLDRAGTLDEKYMRVNDLSILEVSYISLHEKHHLIHKLHSGPAYEREDLRSRIDFYLDCMVEVNTRRADTLVDVTADRVGLSALQVMAEIKAAREGSIDLQIAAYSPLGFKDSEPQRWRVFEQGSEQADFIAALPEADDTDDYPDHIGFEEHMRRTLELAKSKGCMLHVHTDQRNEPSENGTERLLECISRYGAPASTPGHPSVWAVHMISPSTYDEPRFKALLAGLQECNIGVVCCPSAALGMRQLRPLSTPTYNSIPRVLELLVAGIPVRLASDNIADICSPSTTANLIDEVFVLSAALRFYNVDILAKLATGTRLDAGDLSHVRLHLEQNDREIARVLNGPC
jgi:cytosine/adenosine deaminase-related metal-dependent hydrolase